MISDRSDCESVANVANALHEVGQILTRLRALADAGLKMGDDLTNGLDSMSRDERFEAAMQMWRQFSKVSSACTFVELNTQAAVRNTNTLLSEMVVFEDDDI